MKQKVIRKSIDLKKLYLTQLPDLSDVRVEGHFWCSFNQLKSLKGAPKYVGKSFFCTNNQLENLIGAPKYVGANFNCSINQLKSLKGLPEYIGGFLFLPRHLKELYTEEDIRKMSDTRGDIIFL